MEKRLGSLAQLKDAEDLATVNRRFEEALQSARHIMYRLNVQQGGYDYLSPFFAELTGYPVSEFKDITIRQLPDFFHPDDRERIFGEDGELARAVESQVGNKSILLVEYRFRKADGSYCWLRDQSTVYIGADNQLESIVGAAYDITELLQTEEALKSGENKFRTLIECSTDVIFVLDDHGMFRFASPAWEKHFGFPVVEIIGREFAQFVHPDDVLPCMEHLQQVLTSGQAATSPPYRVKHADGSWRHFVANGTRYNDISGISRYLGVARDITGQKQAEEERLNLERQLLNAQKLESLGVLAGGIAHDFNNILTAILGNISYARTGLDGTSPAFAPLERAEKAAQRAAKLARQLLVFAKGGEPVKQFFLLQQTITEAVSLVLSGTTVQGIIDLQEGLYAVNADEGQISQAFHNIILNAVQAMPAGGRLFVSGSNVAIAVDNSFGLPAGDYVTISVTDEGCGIAPENVARVFDPYFTSKAGGSGLGLASAYTIINKHAGQITVNSPPGKGAVFTVMLPGFGHSEPAESGNEPAVNTHEAGSILVMDDDEMVRELAEIMLQRLGYSVVSCPDGTEAVSLYRQALHERAPFSLCIMDLTIPGGMGGIEAARQIIALDPGAKLVVSSGYSDDPVMADFAAYGFCAALEKPYNVKEIAGIIQKTNP